MNRWVWRQVDRTNDASRKSGREVLIMGILNATPDSFSGDGTPDPGELVDRGLRMIADGADILDIGGESSRPFAAPVTPAEERHRVIPVIRALKNRTETPLSIDTRHAETARAALDAGASIVNDISGLSDPGMRHVVADSEAAAIIMHMQGDPATMQTSPDYPDVVRDVAAFLDTRVNEAVRDGIERERIAVDPGIGFGKTLAHNLALIRNLDRLRPGSCPIVLGVSRKSMIGALLDLPVERRLEGSLAAAAAGVCRGPDVLRVHDVAETRRFLTVFLQALGIGES